MEVRIHSAAPADEVRSANPGKYELFDYSMRNHMAISRLFEGRYISDVLNLNAITGWRNRGYFIISQPASGKTTFVLETVIPLAISRGKRIAIVVPRTALALQYKRDIAKVYTPDILSKHTLEGLNQIQCVGPADIIKMQEFSNPISREKFCKKAGMYDFFVFDEVHSFVGDSSFNTTTEVVLRDLVLKAGRNAKRLYLTATPDIILNEVVELENELGAQRGEPSYEWERDSWVNTTVFRFRSSYDFVKPAFFREYPEICETVTASGKDEKVLIFVASKEQGRELETKFGKDQAVFIDATTKLESKKDEFTEILNTSQFKQKFLIVTRFLDVGVNLKDKSIRYVVVDSVFKEDVIQMAGRRRPDQGVGDKFQLFIRIPSISRLREIRGKIFETKEEIEKNGRDFRMKSGAFDAMPKPFTMQKRGPKVWFQANSYAFHICDYHLRAIDGLLKGITEDAIDQPKLDDKFIEEVLSWLPGHLPEDRRGRGLDAVAEATAKLLEEQVDTVMDKAEYGKFCDRIFEALQIRRRKSQEGAAATSTLNDALQRYGLPYHAQNLSKEQDGKGKYRIERGSLS